MASAAVIAMALLSPTASRRTSAAVAELFDNKARVLRRERAFRSGPVIFLHVRAFEDILDRLSGIKRTFQSALLVGTPHSSWPNRLRQYARSVQAMDPGAGLAAAAGAIQSDADLLEYPASSFDLCVAIGTLDSLNQLPAALLRLHYILRPDSLLIGAIAGGDTLPQLRAAMRAADSVKGEAFPRVHPRIDPASLGQLLNAAGFQMSVVDVDRVKVAYRSLGDLIHDLRGMGATNVLTERSRRPLARAAFVAAEQQFMANPVEGRTIETFELLHFAAWTPATDDRT